MFDIYASNNMHSMSTNSADQPPAASHIQRVSTRNDNQKSKPVQHLPYRGVFKG